MDDPNRRRREVRDLRSAVTGAGVEGADPPGVDGLASLAGLADALALAGQRRRDARDVRGALTASGRDARDVREAPGRRDAEKRQSASARGSLLEVSGEGRVALPGRASEPLTIKLDDSGLSIETRSAPPVRAAYRDLRTISIQQGSALLVLGEGPDALRWIVERFGDRLGPLVRELRERRLEQQLADALVQVPDEPTELVEYDWRPAPDGREAGTPGGGVGQLLVHRWGFVLTPLDEREPSVSFRRGSIRSALEPEPGVVTVDAELGRLELRGLGAASRRVCDRLGGLRDAAFSDAARFIELLLPDAPFAVRRRAAELLVDGRPTRPDELGEGWPLVEAAVLGEPGFAESYRALQSMAGPATPHWLAMAPADPGGPEPKIWFFVALPGNLVAMELVSAGAHATYFFRVVARAEYRGETPQALGPALERAVRDVSGALVDARFLREPMALPAEQLGLPEYLRYRLALSALPALAAARRRFVARVVHRDPASWSAATTALVSWHATCRDDAVEWPGRAAQEAQVGAASGGDGGVTDVSGRSGG